MNLSSIINKITSKFNLKNKSYSDSLEIRNNIVLKSINSKQNNYLSKLKNESMDISLLIKGSIFLLIIAFVYILNRKKILSKNISDSTLKKYYKYYENVENCLDDNFKKYNKTLNITKKLKSLGLNKLQILETEDLMGLIYSLLLNNYSFTFLNYSKLHLKYDDSEIYDNFYNNCKEGIKADYNLIIKILNDSSTKVIDNNILNSNDTKIIVDKIKNYLQELVTFTIQQAKKDNSKILDCIRESEDVNNNSIKNTLLSDLFDINDLKNHLENNYINKIEIYDDMLNESLMYPLENIILKTLFTKYKKQITNKIKNETNTRKKDLNSKFIKDIMKTKDNYNSFKKNKLNEIDKALKEINNDPDEKDSIENLQNLKLIINKYYDKFVKEFELIYEKDLKNWLGI